MDSDAFWAARLDDAEGARASLSTLMAAAEQRRARAKFNTGSITLTAALALRGLSMWANPSTIVEVGTFIGVSTAALLAPQIYTCDISNDCLPSAPGLKTYPYTKSTAMFRNLVKRGVVADLFFFDGLLSQEDVPLILSLSAPGAVYVFDDFNGQFKGVQNVAKLRPVVPAHVLIPASGPVAADTTLAVLAPPERL